MENEQAEEDLRCMEFMPTERAWMLLETCSRQIITGNKYQARYVLHHIGRQPSRHLPTNWVPHKLSAEYGARRHAAELRAFHTDFMVVMPEGRHAGFAHAQAASTTR